MYFGIDKAGTTEGDDYKNVFLVKQGAAVAWVNNINPSC